jgi:hypothetical protein
MSDNPYKSGGEVSGKIVMSSIEEEVLIAKTEVLLANRDSKLTMQALAR